MLYCVFPLESSAKHNKKAVLSTAIFVLLTHCFVQARQCVLKTKATLSSGFLVALCARDSGGIRTHDPQLRRLLLYPTELRNQSYFRCQDVVQRTPYPLKLRKSNTKKQKTQNKSAIPSIARPCCRGDTVSGYFRNAPEKV